MSEQVRIQKILADQGIASRREAEEMIELGEVTVNGKVAKLGDKADPDKDHIKVGGKLLKKAEGKVVVALFKPRGILTRKPVDDEANSAQTVIDLIPRIKEKVKPIGQLDSDAEGILLLTNDNELFTRLNQAKFEVEKVFNVKIDGHLDENRLRRLEKGVPVEGQRSKPAKAEITRQSEGKSWVKLTTSEVRNRHIRKLFEAIGRPVDKVSRESFAGITTHKLVRGQYRYLTDAEMGSLYKLVGLKTKK